MPPRSKKIRQGGMVSKSMIVAQWATRAQVRKDQGQDELLEPLVDVVEA